MYNFSLITADYDVTATADDSDYQPVVPALGGADNYIIPSNSVYLKSANYSAYLESGSAVQCLRLPFLQLFNSTIFNMD